ncbi:methyl-accepting chemotaxis protein [bacterium]
MTGKIKSKIQLSIAPIGLILIGLIFLSIITATLFHQTYLVLIFTGIGFTFSLILLLLEKFNLNSPSGIMINHLKNLLAKDVRSLATSMVELSQGDLSLSLSVESEPLPKDSEKDFGDLGYFYNNLISYLQAIANEFNNISDPACHRLCYVGADSSIEGYHCGEIMGELLNGKGQVVILISFLSTASHVSRLRGFQTALKDQFPDIECIEILETKEDSALIGSIVSNICKKYPKLAGIYVTDGNSPPHVARYIINEKKEGQIKIVAHDLGQKTMEFMKKGVITATISQDAFAQGHDPLIHLYNHLMSGWHPHISRLLTKLETVTRDNLDDFWHEKQGAIISEAAMEKLITPVDKKPDKPLRFVILGEEGVFWNSIQEGVTLAAEKLKPLNVQVDYVVPGLFDVNTGKMKNIENYRRVNTQDYIKVIEYLIADQVDGIATLILNRDLIPYINKAVNSGIPVVSYNTEPFGIRSLLATITDQAQKLTDLSKKMANSASETSTAISFVNEAMDEVAQGSNQQTKQVDTTQETLESLVSHITRVNWEAEHSMKAMTKTTNAVVSGFDGLQTTLSNLEEIEQSMDNFSQHMNNLNEQSNEIDMVVELINDIASRVNVLALNASIEATKAGEYGHGFMVVAKEIRALAKNAKEATGNVIRLINSIQQGITHVDKQMNSGLYKLKQSGTVIDQSRSSLENIKPLVEEDKNRIQRIVKSIHEIQKSSEDVGNAMKEVQSVSVNNTEAVHKVNQSTKEMNLQMDSVIQLAQLLEDMAETEQNLLVKFNINGQTEF